MGASEPKYKVFLKEQNVAGFTSDYVLQNNLSNRVMKVLTYFTPNLEINNTDETFLNFDRSTFKVCIRLCQKIMQTKTIHP